MNRYTLTKLKKKTVSFTLLLRNIAEQSSHENLKVIKNTSPDKSGNPESLKK